ncbi:MAG: DUF2029 domain-containing protein [Candidatus Zixiibacteriota bacterium]|nr:MAG: DUF2029 domain-containing protein [candidate division Zixibacteria bacterium]
MNRELIKTISDRRSLKVVALLLLALVLAVLLVQTFHKAYREGGYDFTSYLLSASALAHGENPYQSDTPFPYIYPMFLALVLIPLSVIPYWLANLIWYAVNVASLLGSIVVVVRLSSNSLLTDWKGKFLTPVVLSLLLLLPVIQNNLLNGQANFLVLFLCVLTLKYYRESRVVPASICLALASAIKLVPLFLILFLVLRREFRMFGLAAILFVIFCLLPVITLGGDILTIYGEYWHDFLFGKISTGTVGKPDQIYFTLSGFVSQIVPSISGWAWLKLISALVVAATVSVIDLLAVRRSGKASGVWTFHLYLVAILMITPLSETHHLAFLIPLLVLLVVRLIYDNQSPAGFHVATVAIFILLFYLGRALGGPFYFLALTVLFPAVMRVAMVAQLSQPAESV